MTANRGLSWTLLRVEGFHLGYLATIIVQSSEKRPLSSVTDQGLLFHSAAAQITGWRRFYREQILLLFMYFAQSKITSWHMMTESSERGENTQRAHWSLQPNNVNKVNENTTYTESYHDMLLAHTHRTWCRVVSWMLIYNEGLQSLYSGRQPRSAASRPTIMC